MTSNEGTVRNEGTTITRRTSLSSPATPPTASMTSSSSSLPSRTTRILLGLCTSAPPHCPHCPPVRTYQRSAGDERVPEPGSRWNGDLGHTCGRAQPPGRSPARDRRPCPATHRRRAPDRARSILRCDLLLAAGLGDLRMLEGGPDVHRIPAIRACLLGLADRHRHAVATARAHDLVLRHLTHLRYVLVPSFQGDKDPAGALRTSATTARAAWSDPPEERREEADSRAGGHAGT